MGGKQKAPTSAFDVGAFHQYIIFLIAAPVSGFPVNKTVTVVYTRYIEASFSENAEQ